MTESDFRAPVCTNLIPDYSRNCRRRGRRGIDLDLKSFGGRPRLRSCPVPEEKPVSLAPLDLEKALKGLLGVKPPDKAEKPKRKKKASPTKK